mmetsp:Transcript_46947/g.92416  ORF Transcript_46947/g.92416 Transcript_46947/m.92416 type:complete len:308 (+) Transcript_46947:96-1019(+)|eukprot:CAMPEP_0175144446 /NCGR_PEP_ID=MMETSP0087-20121206/14143_1 /TAXON_ID=136419 /ORGANISM="Unknown Unknown, Strain D1" /LENGTH=307 /DNA_ID=CAMNT_0016428929 /DNA_START=96 /DNA_END=1019 /DNA_ORIENTATION=+
MHKTIKTILPRPHPHWVGDGFNVFPVFADKAFSKELSPFLMFDYAAPKHFAATTKRLGVGQHPHRGFETVTLAFQGAVEHGDSVGNRGVIETGDVQWMTAARGIIHEEFHSTEFAKKGGLFEMCQLWVNLPSKHKMAAPRYQGIMAKDIPHAPLALSSGEAKCSADGKPAQADPNDGFVRVISGNYHGVRGAADTYTPVDMWDIILNTAGKTFQFTTGDGFNVVVFVRAGKVEVEGSPVGPQDVALMNLKGTVINIKALEPNTKVLLLGGEPIDEPIAARGPFVMNTQQELKQAVIDYQTGKFGQHF